MYALTLPPQKLGFYHNLKIFFQKKEFETKKNLWKKIMSSFDDFLPKKKKTTSNERLLPINLMM
jgi:hypothetical protein